MSDVRAVLCDLDDTLFDHAHATRTALDDVYAAVPGFGCWSFEEFARRHDEILELMHLKVLAGNLSIPDARVERFRRLLSEASAARPDERAPQVARIYRRAYEVSWQPVRGAVHLLAALKRSGRPVAVVTNNVMIEQRMKLLRCGLADYVHALVTSEEIGAQKPEAAIFHAALARLDARATETVMIGDGWATDIEGARSAGLRAIWFNRRGASNPDPTVPEVRSFDPCSTVLELLSCRS